MKTMTIEIRKKSAEAFLHVLEEQKSIRIIDNSSNEKFKRKLKKDLTEAFNQVNLAEQGKVKLNQPENFTMSYKVEATSTFQKELKPLVKKYPSLKEEFLELVEELERNPEIGTSLGQNCFKIRIAIKSKGKGKSGGARIITCVKVQKQKVSLLTIYDKSEKDTISDSDLKDLLKEVV